MIPIYHRIKFTFTIFIKVVHPISELDKPAHPGLTPRLIQVVCWSMVGAAIRNPILLGQVLLVTLPLPVAFQRSRFPRSNEDCTRFDESSTKFSEIFVDLIRSPSNLLRSPLYQTEISNISVVSHHQ